MKENSTSSLSHDVSLLYLDIITRKSSIPSSVMIYLSAGASRISLGVADPDLERQQESLHRDVGYKAASTTRNPDKSESEWQQNKQQSHYANPDVL